MKAIETIYNGYKFRSRLEARWAVFFDALGVKYEYEPEGFEFSDGTRYLPDFKVKCWGKRGHLEDTPFDLWIEVKSIISEKDKKKIRMFAYGEDAYTQIYSDDGRSICEKFVEYGDKLPNYSDIILNPILILGNIPDDGRTSYGEVIGSYKPLDEHSKDLFKTNGIYPFNFELIDGDFFGTGFQLQCGKLVLGGDDSNYGGTSDSLVDEAYEIARQASFEYGKNPSFFTINDVGGAKIIIRKHGIRYLVAHQMHMTRHSVEMDSASIGMLLYSLGGRDTLEDFVKWKDGG